MTQMLQNIPKLQPVLIKNTKIQPPQNNNNKKVKRTVDVIMHKMLLKAETDKKRSRNKAVSVRQ